MSIKTEELIPIISNIKKRISEISAGRIIYLTISGAHLYGFPSFDSDIDFRGSFLAHTNNFIGLNKCRESITSINPDYQVHEIGKVIKLCIKGNCNILEHVLSKQIVSTPEYFKLKELIFDALAKRAIYNSYRGMATFNYKKFILGGKATYKKYLYVFRGLLAGRYFLETGMIEPDINKLNKVYKIDEVKKLIKAKREREEKAVVQDMDSGKLDELITLLYNKIDTAYENSKLQDIPSKHNIKKLNSFLIKLRKSLL